MSRRAQENLMALAILIVFIGVIVTAFNFGPRARMVPLPVATFGLVLLVIQVVWQNLRSTDELQVDLLEVLTRRTEEGSAEGKTGDPSSGGTGQQESRPAWMREAGAFGIVAVLLALVLLLGPIPAIFVFTGGYFLVSRHYSWLKGFIYTAAFTAVVYLLFVVALEVQLYHGVLEPLVERLR
jgi:hypothetical protein